MATDFISRLHESAHWEAYVAAAFTREGFFVRLSPNRLGWEYQGNIDLHVALDEKGPWAPVEVKGSGPRVENGLVLLCAEKAFSKHVALNVPSPALYAHWVFCNPLTGKMSGAVSGVPVSLGHLQEDTARMQVYAVVKMAEEALWSWEKLIVFVKTRLGNLSHNKPPHWANGGGDTPGGNGGCAEGPEGTIAPQPEHGKSKMGGQKRPPHSRHHPGLQDDKAKGWERMALGEDEHKAGGSRAKLLRGVSVSEGAVTKPFGGRKESK